MSGRSSSVQWYQSPAAVTASLKLRPAESRGPVTARFKENYCAVYDGEELYWEAWLAGPVVTAKCKLVTHGSRAEVKLTKARNIKWEEFQVSTPIDAESAHNGGSVPTTNSYIPEDLLFVEHISHDFFDMNDRMKVKVQVGGVVSSSCKVSFSEEAMELKFQTRNAKFLRMFEDCSKNMFFVWKIQLFGKIVPSQSSWTVFSDHVEIILKKQSTNRWKTLSAPHIRPVKGSSLSNELPNTMATTENGVLVSSNWNGVADPLPNDVTNGLPSSDIRATGNSATASPSNLVSSLATPTLYDTPPPSLHSASSSTSGYSSNASDTSENDRRGVANASATRDTKRDLASLEHGGMNDMDIDTPCNMVHSANSATPPSNYRNHPLAQADVNRRGHSSVEDFNNRDYPSAAENLPLARDCSTNIISNSFPSSSNGPSHNHVPINGTNSDNQNVQFMEPSLTGLINIGNSCFMNSVVQCLSNTHRLRQYFMDRHFYADINKQNPLGFKGQLATCFFDAIKNLWSGHQYSSLRRLKSIVASRSESFGGYQQQDSHEFMSYLLDGLHEDLNRIQEKPVTTMPEGHGLDDSVLAEKAWQVHRERNDSFFVDHFQGQFKSTLVCPVCQNVSVTFDPFMSLSVPISRNLRCLPVFFIAQDPSKVPRQIVLKLPPDANLELLRASVGRRTGISMVQLRMFEVFNNKFHNLLSSNQQPIASIGEKDVIIVCEVASGSHSEEVVEVNMIQRVQLAPFPTKCASCGRRSEGDKKLQRCSKCKAVGYCNKACQGHDWSEHKMKCRKGRPTPVGLPFVVSMLASEFTYSHLAAVAEQFAKRSVDVSVQLEAVTENTNSIQSKNTGSENEDTDAKDVPKKSLEYLFVPVDRYGDNQGTAQPLEDLGDTPLSFRGQYLAMDWQNDSKTVQVNPKPILDHEVDPTVSMVMNSKPHPLSDGVTLDQCIELFTQPETLSKEEAWYCSKCKEHREATKQISIWKLPTILIIHLKRFCFSGNYHRDKLKDMVDFPLRDLDMTPFMPEEASSPLAPPIYDLYATVNHYGAVYMGHYIAQVKHPAQNKKWLLYDDDSVRIISEDEVVDPTAYILFYRLRGH